MLCNGFEISTLCQSNYPHSQGRISRAGKKGPYASWIIRSDVLCSFSAPPLQLCWSAVQIGSTNRESSSQVAAGKTARWFFSSCVSWTQAMEREMWRKRSSYQRAAAFSQGRKQQRSLLRRWWMGWWCGKDWKAFSRLWVFGASWHTKGNTHYWYCQQTPPSKEYFCQRENPSKYEWVQFMNNSTAFILHI